MNKAKFIKELDGWTGDARLYKVDPPIPKGYKKLSLTTLENNWGDSDKEFTHVIVSATVVPFSGSETYIFGCDENGENVNFIELEGSFRGGLDHEQALKDAGYEL